MFVLLPASSCIYSFISPISSIVISSVPQTINKSTFLHPLILLSFSNGESNAFTMASWALLFPLDEDDPIIALPLSFKTVLASFKSIFWVKWWVITSAIPRAALARTSSAFENPALKPRFPYTSRSLLLLITIKESTLFLRFSRPFWAWSNLNFPSNWKGIVTIPTVRISISFAISAIIGAAPVPVPPPIPAVIKTIFVLVAIKVLISL